MSKNNRKSGEEMHLYVGVDKHKATFSAAHINIGACTALLITPGTLCMLMSWSPDYYRDVRPLADNKVTIWDNNGWAVRASSKKSEILLWVSPYYLKCGSGCSYFLREASTWQTMAICIPKPSSIDAPMVDNDFVADGWYPSDLRNGSDLKVISTKKAVEWKIGSSSIICEPPDWTIHHRSERVDLELLVHTDFPPIELRKGSEPGADYKWYMASANVAGQARIFEEKMDIEGFAHHERHTHMKEGFNPADNKQGKGIWWIAIDMGGDRVFVQLRPSLHIAKAWVLTSGKLEEVEGEQKIFLKEGRMWTDPRSMLSVPSNWTLEIKFPAKTIRANIWAQARSYYLWSYLRDSYMLLYWWLAHGIVQVKGTKIRRTESAKCIVHSNRIFMKR